YPIQSRADRGDDWGERSCQREGWFDCPRPLNEQRDGGVAGQVFWSQLTLQIRCVERRHGKLVLPAHAQRDPAGEQRLDARTRRQKLRDFESSLNHLLEVIKHEQQLSAGQIFRELFTRGLVRLVTQTKRLPYRWY